MNITNEKFKLGYINKKTYLWISKLNIVKMLVLPKLAHMFSKIPIKILASPVGSQILCGKEMKQKKKLNRSRRNQHWLAVL